MPTCSPWGVGSFLTVPCTCWPSWVQAAPSAPRQDCAVSPRQRLQCLWGGCQQCQIRGWLLLFLVQNLFLTLQFPCCLYVYIYIYICVCLSLSIYISISFQAHSIFVSEISLWFPGYSLICLVVIFLFHMTKFGQMPAQLALCSIHPYHLHSHSYFNKCCYPGHLPRVDQVSTPTRVSKFQNYWSLYTY